jgi:hypothetical protein
MMIPFVTQVIGDSTALPVKPLLQTTCGYAGTSVWADTDASSALLHFDIVRPHVSLIVFGKLLALFMSVTPRACALSIHDFFAEPAELLP